MRPMDIDEASSLANLSTPPTRPLSALRSRFALMTTRDPTNLVIEMESLAFWISGDYPADARLI